MENKDNTKMISGVTSWNAESPVRGNKSKFVKENLPRFPFINLKKGKNLVRVVSAPAVYYSVKLILPKTKNKFGDRIRSYTDAYIEEIGKRPTDRYYAFVIDRADQKLKILDMNSGVQGDIKRFKNEKNQDRDSEMPEITPMDFDVNIIMDPDAPPAKFYAPSPRDNKPLTAADLELINSISEETMVKILTSLSYMPTKEVFFKNITELGWVPGMDLSNKKEEDEVANTSTDKKLSQPDEGDFNFDRNK